MSVKDAQLLEEVVQTIVEAVNPHKIILFGSRARADAHPESDLDLLIIKESTLPRYQRAIPIYHALRTIMVPMDVIVYTPAEVEEWAQVSQAFVTTAIREGKVLYEKQG